jgi:hypothetical protein
MVEVLKRIPFDEFADNLAGFFKHVIEKHNQPLEIDLHGF